jgi:tRNA (cmo5U34)-methyltransferase
MDTTTVKRAFDLSANTYDQSRRQLIPCFDAFYGTVLELIPYTPQDRFRVLDLGAGTGLLGQLVAQRFPRATVALMDISEAMLAKAKERFAQMPGAFEFMLADYTAGVSGEFEVVVSALSIHHLTDLSKAKLFGDILAALTPGGLFVNADQVLGATPGIDRIYRERWLRQVREMGCPLADLEAAMERMQEDKMAPVDHQLSWLRQAGFHEVNCWYQNYSFAVYSGSKG